MEGTPSMSLFEDETGVKLIIIIIIININISVTPNRNYKGRTIGLNSHAVIC